MACRLSHILFSFYMQSSVDLVYQRVALQNSILGHLAQCGVFKGALLAPEKMIGFILRGDLATSAHGLGLVLLPCSAVNGTELQS
ncbi:hypothetical protein GDO78_018698 [Eleutherodactylus coqui]|uniref:Uncharacterized protein n=1 Tax=Eleutherodactylus coqui TaxID=57060 RepID=A0A8J6B8M4_ELECQ|nr:hypothetical protein GDO78_018698 [Eleutherodactylus coqui]